MKTTVNFIVKIMASPILLPLIIILYFTPGSELLLKYIIDNEEDFRKFYENYKN